MSDRTPDAAETQDLVDRVRGGDPSAFEQLFARYRPFLREMIELRLDPRLRRRVDPSDIVQETQLEVFRRLSDYLERQPMPFRLWLRKTAYERLLMVRRQHLGAARRAVGREEALADESSFQLAQHLVASDSTPSQRLDKADAINRVRRAVAQLSENDREILLMRNLEMLSNREVAQVLEIDPSAASQRYGRALLRLRRLLLADGLTESPS